MTTFAGHTIPPLFSGSDSASGGGGGGSFTTAPINFLDADYFPELINVQNFQFSRLIRFRSLAPLIGTLRVNDAVNGGLINIAGQWHNGEPNAPNVTDFAVAWISSGANSGNGMIPFDQAVLGEASNPVGQVPISGQRFRTNNNSDSWNSRFNPVTQGVGIGNYWIEEVFQISLFAAPFTVLAQATLTLRLVFV